MRSKYLFFALFFACSFHALTEEHEIELKGLAEPAQILVDKWGVPHIYAQNYYDVFFVQGFNAARDRLWQIDTWRRRGLGKLSEVFGDNYIEQDKAARLFLYRGDLYSEWLAYGNDAKRITYSFAQGINAFIELTKDQPKLLPLEFELLDYKPEPWSAADIVKIRSNGLWRNVTREVWRAQLACSNKLPLAAKWKKLEPEWKTKVPLGLDPCVIPSDVLDKYLLAKAPVSFEDPISGAMVTKSADPFDEQLGSNNWAVAPSRTTTGRPILADDPHRSHAVPSLRYISHLVGPGINVIGAGEPALPGISIGHNERIAFGLTIFPIDQEDLYVYEKKRKGYRYGSHYEPFKKVTESLLVKDSTPVDIEMKFTRHGPVIHETKKHAFVLRAAWLEPGMAPYFGSIEYMGAENFRSFVAALNRWGAPSENQVYADIEGNIGYKPAGRFPKRDNWDGLLPVPGDGRYEWDGYFDMDSLPIEYNPPRGYTGTANSMNLPANYPIKDFKVGFEWSAPWRYKRIMESLSTDVKHSLEHSSQLQRDYKSLLAKAVIKKLPDLSQYDINLLTNWDFTLASDSAAAALWAVWYYKHLVPNIKILIDPYGQRPSGSSEIDSLMVLELLDTQKGKSIAYKSLESAIAALKISLGESPEKWQWGDLHQMRFSHPLINVVKEEVQKDLAIIPYPRGGSANTTNNTGFSGKNFDVRSGASFRMVIDVGNWDNSEMTNAPGQSGDPKSYFYDNLLEGWAKDQSFPLLYSRAKINENLILTLNLKPAKTQLESQPQ